MDPTRKSFALGCMTGALLGPVLLVVLGLGAIFLFRDFFTDYAARQQAGRLAPPSLGTGLEADYTLAFQDDDGNALSLEEFRGRTVFLYFWHPECVPCIAGLPAMKRLEDAVADLDVALLLIALEDSDDIEALRQTHGITSPIYLIDGERPQVFDTKNITPAAFLIDPDGAIVFRRAGAAKWDAEALTALVRAVATSE